MAGGVLPLHFRVPTFLLRLFLHRLQDLVDIPLSNNDPRRMSSLLNATVKSPVGRSLSAAQAWIRRIGSEIGAPRARLCQRRALQDPPGRSHLVPRLRDRVCLCGPAAQV